MSIIVGEVIAVSGVRISLRIFEDSNHETIYYGGVKYRGISLREHVTIQRGFIDIVCLVEGEFLDEKRLEADAEKIQYVLKANWKNCSKKICQMEKRHQNSLWNGCSPHRLYS